MEKYLMVGLLLIGLVLVMLSVGSINNGVMTTDKYDGGDGEVYGCITGATIDDGIGHLTLDGTTTFQYSYASLPYLDDNIGRWAVITIQGGYIVDYEVVK